MSKFIAAWPVRPPPTASLYSSKDALAEYIAGLTALNAAVIGHINGDNTVDTFTPNPAPLNPGAGVHGHDHSGGEFGRPFFRTLAHFYFGDFNDGSVNWSNGENPTRITLTRAVASAADDIGPVWTGRNYARIPGCDPINGAYLHLGIAGVIRVVATSGVAGGDVFKLMIANRHPDVNVTVEFDIVATSTGEKRFESASGTRLPVVPGQVNPIEVGYRIDVDGTVATRSVEVLLYDLELGVYDASV